jgi:alkylation response protein AidB-like acyl-CoA dehydrogenase
MCRHSEGVAVVDREKLIGAAQELVPVLRDRARKTEQQRRVPDETISDLQDAGLFKILQPAYYGGYEADLATYFDVVLALSAADGSVGWVYSVLLVQTWALSLMDPQASDEVWRSDPSARMDRDQVLATKRAVTAVDRVFAGAGAGVLSLDNPIQRAGRDVHAGAAHFAAVPEGKLAAYGALAFGLGPTAAH